MVLTAKRRALLDGPARDVLAQALYGAAALTTTDAGMARALERRVAGAQRRYFKALDALLRLRSDWNVRGRWALSVGPQAEAGRDDEDNDEADFDEADENGDEADAAEREDALLRSLIHPDDYEEVMELIKRPNGETHSPDGPGA